MGSFPGGGGGSNSNTNSSPMRPNSGGGGGRPGQDRCGSSSAFDNCQSIPIKVVHSAKARAYEGASHTTPIQPQQATQQSQASPTLIVKVYCTYMTKFFFVPPSLNKCWK